MRLSGAAALCLRGIGGPRHAVPRLTLCGSRPPVRLPHTLNPPRPPPRVRCVQRPSAGRCEPRLRAHDDAVDRAPPLRAGRRRAVGFDSVGPRRRGPSGDRVEFLARRRGRRSARTAGLGSARTSKRLQQQSWRGCRACRPSLQTVNASRANAKAKSKRTHTVAATQPSTQTPAQPTLIRAIEHRAPGIDVVLAQRPARMLCSRLGLRLRWSGLRCALQRPCAAPKAPRPSPLVPQCSLARPARQRITRQRRAMVAGPQQRRSACEAHLEACGGGPDARRDFGGSCTHRIASPSIKLHGTPRNRANA